MSNERGASEEPGAANELDAAKYVSFMSYKRDGTPISLPVWVTPFEGGYAFTTEATAYKVKRVTRDPRVTLTVCDIRGKIRPGATVHSGTAEVLDGDAARRVKHAISRKYRVGSALIEVMATVRRLASRGKNSAADGAIKVTLDR